MQGPCGAALKGAGAPDVPYAPGGRTRDARAPSQARRTLSPPRGLAPGDQAADSLAHIDLRAPAEDPLGQAVIHRPSAARAQLHLARFGLDVLRREILAGKLGDQAHDLKGGRRPWS